LRGLLLQSSGLQARANPELKLASGTAPCAGSVPLGPVRAPWRNTQSSESRKGWAVSRGLQAERPGWATRPLHGSSEASAAFAAVCVRRRPD